MISFLIKINGVSAHLFLINLKLLMRKNVIIILFTLLTFLMFQSCFNKLTRSGSLNNKKSETPKFKNQGAKEKYDIKQIFMTRYQTQSFNNYAGKINILNTNNSSLISFDSVCVRLYLEDGKNKYNKIFMTDLLSDQLPGLKWKNDTISVSNLEYLNYTNNLPTQRRFSFLVHNGFMLNPSVILIELTNKNSNRYTDFDKFIKGAKLTFFLNAWIQI